MNQKIIISHRGNLEGPNPLWENNIGYVESALKVCLFCEVDLWRFGQYLFLSHDKPQTTGQYQLGIEQFLGDNRDKLVIHCKNIQALQMMTSLRNKHQYNYFWHENDQYTLTSKEWIWAFPNKGVYSSDNLSLDAFTVAVLPELENTNTTNFMAICTDYVYQYMAKNTFEIEKELKKT